jgi:hypothetical protein
MVNYILGYGSLINARSRARTGRSGRAIRVRISGLSRAWNFRSERNRMTALGVLKVKGATTNGVLVRVSKRELKRFDRREKGYKREQIENSNITLLAQDNRPLAQKKLPLGNVWAYFPIKSQQPTKHFPIRQSYLDVVLTGCLNLKCGEPFAAEFIRTTKYWRHPIDNDRSAPKYVRYMKRVPKTKLIDKLLTRNGLTSRTESRS